MNEDEEIRQCEVCCGYVTMSKAAKPGTVVPHGHWSTGKPCRGKRELGTGTSIRTVSGGLPTLGKDS